MLNKGRIAKFFGEDNLSQTCERQIFGYKNNLTYDMSVDLKDIRISDTKGNTVCVHEKEYENGIKRVGTITWADNVSKKLEKAYEYIVSNFSDFYSDGYLYCIMDSTSAKENSGWDIEIFYDNEKVRNAWKVSEVGTDDKCMQENFCKELFVQGLNSLEEAEKTVLELSKKHTMTNITTLPQDNL